MHILTVKNTEPSSSASDTAWLSICQETNSGAICWTKINNLFEFRSPSAGVYWDGKGTQRHPVKLKNNPEKGAWERREVNTAQVSACSPQRPILFLLDGRWVQWPPLGWHLPSGAIQRNDKHRWLQHRSWSVSRWGRRFLETENRGWLSWHQRSHPFLA